MDIRGYPAPNGLIKDPKIVQKSPELLAQRVRVWIAVPAEEPSSPLIVRPRCSEIPAARSIRIRGIGLRFMGKSGVVTAA